VADTSAALQCPAGRRGPVYYTQCIAIGICRSSLLVAHGQDFALHALTLYMAEMIWQPHSAIVGTATQDSRARTENVLPATSQPYCGEKISGDLRLAEGVPEVTCQKLGRERQVVPYR
jgi:hypothetical protein